MPQCCLSKQAINILREFCRSPSNQFGKVAHSNGVNLCLMNGGMIKIAEERFVDDDLHTLCSLGLLSFSMGSNGTELYGATRDAVRFQNS